MEGISVHRLYRTPQQPSKTLIPSNGIPDGGTNPGVRYIQIFRYSDIEIFRYSEKRKRKWRSGFLLAKEKEVEGGYIGYAPPSGI